MTQEAKKRQGAARAKAALNLPPAGPKDLSLGVRCVTFGSPRLGAGYNSYYQIFQTRDSVAIEMELGHEVRVIPIDGRPHLPPTVGTWLGDSRGHWEGDTLVVDTTTMYEYACHEGNYALTDILRGARAEEKAAAEEAAKTRSK